jgi:hypothetical protein
MDIVFRAEFKQKNMKKALFIVALMVYGFGTLAQQSETRKVGSFRGIRAASGIDVYLKKGDAESVRVEVSGTGINNVITEVSGDYLKIQMAESRSSQSRTVKVYVTYVEVDRLIVSSAANIYADGLIRSRSLSLTSSSAGTIDISVNVETIKATASSAGDIELKGNAKRIEIDVASAGEVSAYDLDVEEAVVSASSAGTAKVSVSQRIDARASSGATIRYKGNPTRTNTNSSSGGSVKKSS